MLTSKTTCHSKLASHLQIGRPLKYLKETKKANSKQIPHRLNLKEASNVKEEE